MENKGEKKQSSFESLPVVLANLSSSSKICLYISVLIEVFLLATMSAARGSKQTASSKSGKGERERVKEIERLVKRRK